MSISKNHSNQARINGALSRGPITPEGKKRSAMNALKHGIFAKTALLWFESKADFNRLRAAFIDHYQPQTELELILAEKEAVNLWRLFRLHRIETVVFDRTFRHRRFGFDSMKAIAGGTYYKPKGDGPAKPAEPLTQDDIEETIYATVQTMVEEGTALHIRRERDSLERSQTRFQATLANLRGQFAPPPPELTAGFVPEPPQTE